MRDDTDVRGECAPEPEEEDPATPTTLPSPGGEMMEHHAVYPTNADGTVSTSAAMSKANFERHLPAVQWHVTASALEESPRIPTRRSCGRIPW